MDRRGHLKAMVVGTMPLVWAAGARAQAGFPTKPVKVVVGFPAGTATDVGARGVSEAVGKRLGQAFVVDNRPGAASSIAAKSVMQSPPDGYTLFLGSIANAINSSFPGSNTPDLAKDFIPISMLGAVPNVLVVHPSVPARTLSEFIALARSKPGEITYASSGSGTSPHLSGELFCSMAGVKMLHVPYKGSTPAVTDLIGGQVQSMFSPVSTALPHIRAGKLRALASTGLKRTSVMPDLPTVDELGLKGFETSVWFGLMSPLGTPDAVNETLRDAVQASLGQPEVIELFNSQGMDIDRRAGRQFAAYIESETSKWTKVIQSSGIKPE